MAIHWIIPAGAQDDRVAEWNIGILPTISYNSDLGFQYGACADIFHYGDLFPQYRQRLYVEASRFTGGQSFFHGQFDSSHLIPGVRTTFSASFQVDPLFRFFGFNGLEPYIRDLDHNKDTETARYDYKRSMVRVLADFQGNVAPHVRWVAGLSYWKYDISDIDIKGYNPEATLYHEMVGANVIAPDEARGNSRIELKAGAVYDTRNSESAPSSGIWTEAYFNASPDVFGDGYKYIRMAAHFRHYIPLWGERLVGAYHLAWQGTVAGKAPFCTQQNISTLFLRQTGTDGLGGSNTVRGLLANRLVGDSYAWLNAELRLRLFSFHLVGQDWYLATNPLFDAGMVTSLYKGEELAAFYGKSVKDLRLEALKPHFSAGAGLKLAMNLNFIISAEWAKPFRADDGPGAIYVVLNYIF